MGRQFRPPRRGPDQPAGLAGMSHMPITLPSVVSSSSTNMTYAIPNYGATDISAYGAGDYLLDAPAAGVVKVIFSYTSTAAARVIRGSTSTAVKFGNQGFTQITWGNSTSANAVGLIGINSTLWGVMWAYPTTVSTADSPAIQTS